MLKPIAIGIPVSPNKLVNTIELSGVIPVMELLILK